MKSGETPYRFYSFVHLNNCCSSNCTNAPPLHLCKAVHPHRETDGGAEGVPERLLHWAPLRAAKKLRQRQRAAAELRGQTWN